MAEQLESPEREQWNEVADVQAVGGGIESAVDRGRGGNETFDEFLAVGAIRQQSAPFDFRVDVHQHQSYRVWTRGAQGQFWKRPKIIQSPTGTRELAACAGEDRLGMQCAQNLGMNLKLKVCCVLVALPLFGFSCMAQGTAPVGTNSTAGALDSTNDTNSTFGVVKVPGDQFTNSAGMQLIKAGDYWVGKYEVTQAEYLKVMGSNPSAFSGDDRPVDNVSWNDAMAFCAQMTQKDITARKLPDGYSYSLPTEAQWQSLVGDAKLEDSVTSQKGARGSTEPVGSLGPNSMGLYDTRGNVMEFTLGDTTKPYRVLKGGSWKDNIEINLRLDFRFYCKPDDHQNTFGFRCLLLPPAGTKGSGD
jgi:hypothetical protein